MPLSQKELDVPRPIAPIGSVGEALRRRHHRPPRSSISHVVLCPPTANHVLHELRRHVLIGLNEES